MKRKKYSSFIIVTVAVCAVLLSVSYNNIRTADEARRKQRIEMVDAVIKYSDYMADYAQRKSQGSGDWMIDIRRID